MCIKTRPSKVFAVWPFFSCFSPGLFSCLKVGPMICSVGTAATSFTGLGMAVMRVIFCPSLTPHRFSAFWLRSKCSICSYQLNIWYGGHVPPSILNWFLQGDEVQELAPASSRVGLALQYRQDRPTSPLRPRDPHHHKKQTLFITKNVKYDRSFVVATRLSSRHNFGDQSGSLSNRK